MKKINRNLIYSIAIVFSIECSAQAQWALTGNTGTNPALNFVGTTDNQPLNITTNNSGIGAAQPILFNTNGTTNMTVDAAGNVGIGTTSPPNKLTVSGNANVTGNIGAGVASPAYSIDAATDVNIGSTTLNTGYRINNTVVLQTPGAIGYQFYF